MLINIKTNKPYSVIIEKNSLEYIGNFALKVLNINAKIFIVTDKNVASIYLNTVIESLKKAGFKTSYYIIEPGEKSKDINNFEKIVNAAAKENLNRGDAFLALGGGVVGDLCGFSAASYMRGIKYIQVSTTFLSAIDSSVGGKTAINIERGKNLVGAFYQPSLVVIDSETLKTLSDDEWKSGLGEAVKYAALCGGEIFEIINNGFVSSEIDRLIELCISYKAIIVNNDEFDLSERKVLNLGHTIGHAIEKISNYKIKHGIAVATGLEIVAKTECKRGILNVDDCNKIISLIEKNGLNATINIDKNELIKQIRIDKKAEAENISFVGIRKIGQAYIENIEIQRLINLLCL